MCPVAESLEAAYRAAIYRVTLPDGLLEWHIGRADAEADRRLRALGCEQGWALLTAVNPYSRQLVPAENEQRLQSLQADLRQRGQRFYPAVHRDPEGRWPDEASVFLLDPPAGLAEALGRHWEQHATVRGRLGGEPELVWLS